MNVVLLEKVGKLGVMGDVVTVKDGYARNFLLPKKKALRATQDNLAYFEKEKAALEKQNKTKKAEAEKIAKKIDGKTVPVIRAASEAGRLFGSVSTRDIANAVSSLGETVDRSLVHLNQNFKMLGLFPVEVHLHPEVLATVTINIARSEDEAKIQQKEGRALIVDHSEQEEEMTEEQAVSENVVEEAVETEVTEEETSETEKETTEA